MDCNKKTVFTDVLYKEEKNGQGASSGCIIALNSEQKAVVETLDDNLLVVASAGTGKTETLAARVIRILDSGLATPERILCLTFTNKACQELKDRLIGAVGEKAVKIVCVTIHGFCYEVIKQEAKRKTDIPVDSLIYDEEDCKEVAKNVLVKIGNPFDWKPEVLWNLIGALKDIRITEDFFSGNTSEDYVRALEHLCQQEPTRLSFICGKCYVPAQEELAGWCKMAIACYQDILFEAHGLDFNDLQMQAYELFKDEEVCARWKDSFSYINMDEMQDTSLSQYSIISKIFGNSKLLLCGDYFQTIYEWRGSRPWQVKQMYEEAYKPVEIVFYENHRGTQTLFNCSYDYLKQCFPNELKALYPKDIRAVSHEKGELISLHESGTINEEAAYIYSRMRSMNDALKVEKKADQWGRFCILTRDNWYNAALSKAFASLNAKAEKEGKEKIPFFLVEEFKFFRRMEIKEALAVMKLAVNPFDSNNLERLMKKYAQGVGVKTLDHLQSKELRRLGIRLIDFVNPLTYETGDYYGLLLQASELGKVVVFDVESTGVDTTSDEIIQLAAIRLNPDGSIAEKFMKYVKAGKSVGQSKLVHHISDEMLAAQGEEPEKVFGEFAEFVGDCTVVGHNVNYDISILRSEMERKGLEPIKLRAYYDTLDIFRRFYPVLKNHKLEFLGEHFNVSHKSSHDAFDDICATGELLMYAIREKLLPTREARCQETARHLEKFREVEDKLSRIRALVDTRRPHELLTEIVQEFGMCERYKGEPQRIENLRYMYRYLRDSDKQEDVPARDAVLRVLKMTSLSNSELDAMMKYKAKVPIITVHQAKGLEYDCVFIAGLMENVFPGYRAVNTGDCTEDSRLFYVAMTRAKQRLFLSWSRKDRFGEDANMSRFVEALDDKYILKD